MALRPIAIQLHLLVRNLRQPLGVDGVVDLVAACRRRLGMTRPKITTTLGRPNRARPPDRRSGVTQGLGEAPAAVLPVLDQRLEPGHASADDSQVDLDGRPDPEMQSLPGGVVCFIDDVVDPEGAQTAGDADEQTEAEEDDEGDALGERQSCLEQRPERQRPHDEVGQDRHDGLEEEGRRLLDTLALGAEDIPIIRDGAVHEGERS